MVPAMAVPSDEPRLETLRDSPEISPCSSSQGAGILGARAIDMFMIERPGS